MSSYTDMPLHHDDYGFDKPKRGTIFKLPWLKNKCTVNSVRAGKVYFSSGTDKYQMPLTTFTTYVTAAISKAESE